MRYFLDTEFNGFGGALLSLGIAAEDGRMLYLVDDYESLSMDEQIDPWVAKNVIPLLFKNPPGIIVSDFTPAAEWGALIAAFYEGDDKPHFFADWPSDIADLCKLLITGPGTAVPMPHQTVFTVLRHLDVYPTTLPGAIQHHALWDALALQRWVQEAEAR